LGLALRQCVIARPIPMLETRTVFLIFGDFFRTSTGVTAQGTVASPARLPEPSQVAPDAGHLSNAACLHYPECFRKPPGAGLDRFLVPSVSLTTRYPQ
jgi:hypothetical protein